MIELVRGLSTGQLEAIAALETRTVAADGGRLKLEWEALRSRSGAQVDDLLWWHGDQLVGFLGLYAFAGPDVELAGMVDPVMRRRGIASALLDAALPLGAQRGCRQALLVTPRVSAGGQGFARHRGATLEHSEHALALSGPPTDGPNDPHLTLRAAKPADAAQLSELLAVAFGWPATDVLARITADPSVTVVIEYDGRTVGTLRRTKAGRGAGVYGFAVHPDWQGRGIGREALRRVCRQLRAEGVERIGLEVAVDNDHALGLYTSLGFTEVTTEDYYRLEL